MKVTLTDKSTFKLDSRRVKDDSGNLRLPIQMARTGVQYYLGMELGLNDRAIEKIGVYRSPDEVFKPESMMTAKDIDITLMPNGAHPDDFITPASRKGLPIVGHVTTGGRKEGNWVVVDAIIKDEDGIKLAESGSEIYVSPAYAMELAEDQGFDPDTGEKYEFKQKDIIFNHLSIVDNPRGGTGAKLLDTGEKLMAHKVKLADGQSCSVADEATATLIQANIDGLTKRAKDAEEKAEYMEEEKEKAVADAEMAKEEKEKAKDELEEEKKKTSDSAIAELVSRISKTMDSAKKIAGKDFTCDSMNEVAIKRAALSDAYPKKDWKDLSDAVISYAFDEAEKKKTEDEEEKKNASDSFKKLGDDASNLSLKDSNSMRVNARDSYLQKRYGKKDK